MRELLARHDVQVQLEQYWISAEEAAARVETKTDQEIALIADRLDEVPAGDLRPCWKPEATKTCTEKFS